MKLSFCVNDLIFKAFVKYISEILNHLLSSGIAIVWCGRIDSSLNNIVCEAPAVILILVNFVLLGSEQAGALPKL